jgi:DNA-binding transcriptional MerR regulator
MTVKTLRHYHQIGLLEPAEVDPYTGYRRYAIDQIPAAQVMHRFHDLGMPLEQIQAVLSAPDLRARNQRITAHLRRLEEELGQVQAATASVRDLLAAPAPGDISARIELRTMPAVQAAAITDVVDGARHLHADPGRRTSGHRAMPGTRRRRSGLWHPGRIRGPPRPRGRRADPRVLPRRPARHA